VVRYPALCCTANFRVKSLNIRHLFSIVRHGAVSCKTKKSGLKIRRPQGRGGSSPPLGTNLIKYLDDLDLLLAEPDFPHPVVVNDEETVLRIHGTLQMRRSAMGSSRTLSPFKISSRTNMIILARIGRF
jgi:hypothetical protein